MRGIQTTADDIAVNNIPEIKTDPTKLLNIALSLLPLHAEEDRLCDSLPEATFVAELMARGGIAQETALSLVYTLRRQFEALRLF